MYFINMCTNEKKNLCFWKGESIWSNIYIYNYFPVCKTNPKKWFGLCLMRLFGFIWFVLCSVRHEG